VQDTQVMHLDHFGKHESGMLPRGHWQPCLGILNLSNVSVAFSERDASEVAVGAWFYVTKKTKGPNVTFHNAVCTNSQKGREQQLTGWVLLQSLEGVFYFY
jgi:hypothetical protein